MIIARSLILTLILAVACRASDDKTRSFEKPLSDEEHFGEGHEHNPEYDHEAFMGEEAHDFDTLSPEESKARLAQIVDKMDADNDGSVSKAELRDWIHRSQKKYILDDVDRQWGIHNPDAKEKVSWEDYQKATYGFMDDTESNLSDQDAKTYKDMQRRDHRRWEGADADGDKHLAKEEFGHFLHPEEAESMRDIIIDETLEDIDRDKDGKVSMKEYIHDMYSPESDDEEPPEWVAREEEQFKAHRDKNTDGFMDRDEIRDWIVPADYDHSEAEAVHLLTESDDDKDGNLSKDEILENYDLFVSSQATDFGDALNTVHDEF